MSYHDYCSWEDIGCPSDYCSWDAPYCSWDQPSCPSDYCSWDAPYCSWDNPAPANDCSGWYNLPGMYDMYGQGTSPYSSSGTCPLDWGGWNALLGIGGSALSAWLASLGQSKTNPYAMGVTTTKNPVYQAWGGTNQGILQNLIKEYLTQGAKERLTPGFTPEQAAMYGPVAGQIMQGGTPSEQLSQNILLRTALEGNYPQQAVNRAEQAVGQFANYSIPMMRQQMESLYGPQMFSHGQVDEELIRQEVSRQAQAAQMQQGLAQWEAGMQMQQPGVQALAANQLMQIAPSRYSLPGIMETLGMPRTALQQQQQRAMQYESTAGNWALQLLAQALGHPLSTQTNISPTNVPGATDYLWANLAKVLGPAAQGLLSSLLGPAQG